MTEGIPKLWTYEQLSRHQLRAPILTRSVPKLPFCCLVKSLDTTQQHRDQMLQHSAPKLAIDCIGFLQQSKRSKEICIYIYMYLEHSWFVLQQPGKLSNVLWVRGEKALQHRVEKFHLCAVAQSSLAEKKRSASAHQKFDFMRWRHRFLSFNPVPTKQRHFVQDLLNAKIGSKEQAPPMARSNSFCSANNSWPPG